MAKLLKSDWKEYYIISFFVVKKKSATDRSVGYVYVISLKLRKV